MSYFNKRGVPYPFLDPAEDPNHPLNRVYKIKEDPYLPLGKRERRQLEREAYEEALANYTPAHVIRSYETDPERAATYALIMSLELYPSRPSGELVDLNPPRSPNGSFRPKSKSRGDDERDFRDFAHKRLHVNYNRIHASHGDPRWPSAERPDIAPDEVCWIMEYSMRECNTTRRQLAHALGLFPAVIDPTNQFYDEEMFIRYNEGRRLLCRCRRRNTSCIRPSHIEIFTASKLVLP